MKIPSDLFVCDLANNHFGDVNHAITIVEEIARVQEQTKANLALKFQFRNLDTYIHKEFQSRNDLKYIRRFNETKLSIDDFKFINQRIKDLGLISMATAFDEDSISVCDDLEIDILKVASASANDYSLINELMKLKKPLIVSTGGLRQEEIDKIVFQIRGHVPDFGLMHCVSIYPTEDSDLNLWQVASFKERYQGIRIGWSTHENPLNYVPVALATSLGATIFERHVGINSQSYPLNDYSSNPEILANWIKAQLACRAMLGTEERAPAKMLETETLLALKRGLYSKKEFNKGDLINSSDVYPAFPLRSDISQFYSGEVTFPIRANSLINSDEPITSGNALEIATPGKHIDEVLLQARGMLSKARVEFNQDAEIELSHHYGVDRFREFGAILITCINEEYAKKIIIQLPRQKHPYHFHVTKKESFQLLWGDMELVINGKIVQMRLGQIITVQPGEWHKFSTLRGAVVEEISTTAFTGDSHYDDPIISKTDREQRKTRIKNWILSGE